MISTIHCLEQGITCKIYTFITTEKHEKKKKNIVSRFYNYIPLFINNITTPTSITLRKTSISPPASLAASRQGRIKYGPPHPIDSFKNTLLTICNYRNLNSGKTARQSLMEKHKSLDRKFSSGKSAD